MEINKSAIAELLQSMIKNEITFSPEECTDPLEIGASKIGGKPHVPKHFEWPYFTRTDEDDEVRSLPLSFIAQFNLEELAEYDTDHRLPAHGFLYFFYEMETMCWGFEPEDIGCARVFYYDLAATDLAPASFPGDLNHDYIVPEMQLDFANKNSLPYGEEFDELCEMDIDYDEYDEALQDMGIDLDEVCPEENFKFLGYADIIQNSMLQECETVTSGIAADMTNDISKAEQERIVQGAKDWVLLAQFGTLSDELMFGDCGCIYFYIRKYDLEACRFDKVHLILQCY